jgi:hypothetical protein
MKWRALLWVTSFQVIYLDLLWLICENYRIIWSGDGQIEVTLESYISSLYVISVRQREGICPAPAEQAVSWPHIRCGVWRGTPGHPWPLLGTTEALPRYTLPPQQCKVQCTMTCTIHHHHHASIRATAHCDTPWPVQYTVTHYHLAMHGTTHSHTPILYTRHSSTVSHTTLLGLGSNRVSPFLLLRFFTYGDLPLEQHLRQIQEEALSKFERTEPNTAVPNQPHWDRPVRLPIQYHCSSFSTCCQILLYSSSAPTYYKTMHSTWATLARSMVWKFELISL